MLKYICILLSLLLLNFNVLLITAQLNVVSDENIPSAALPDNGAAVDEVVVESSLYIKPKPKPLMRKARSITENEFGLISLNNMLKSSFVEHKRVKRQRINRPQANKLRQPEYSQSQAISNAAANSNFQNPLAGQFGASAANAQAQAFNSKGPSGSFGASSAGSVTQALNANRLGAQNSAGASMSQTYILPNGQTVNFAATNSFANGGLGNAANSRGGAISITKG